MIPAEVRALITRDPGSVMWDVQLEGTNFTACRWTLWGARRAARRMIRQYTRWGGRFVEVVE